MQETAICLKWPARHDMADAACRPGFRCPWTSAYCLLPANSFSTVSEFSCLILGFPSPLCFADQPDLLACVYCPLFFHHGPILANFIRVFIPFCSCASLALL